MAVLRGVGARLGGCGQLDIARVGGHLWEAGQGCVGDLEISGRGGASGGNVSSLSGHVGEAQTVTQAAREPRQWGVGFCPSPQVPGTLEPHNLARSRFPWGAPPHMGLGSGGGER